MLFIMYQQDILALLEPFMFLFVTVQAGFRKRKLLRVSLGRAAALWAAVQLPRWRRPGSRLSGKSSSLQRWGMLFLCSRALHDTHASWPCEMYFSEIWGHFPINQVPQWSFGGSEKVSGICAAMESVRNAVSRLPVWRSVALFCSLTRNMKLGIVQVKLSKRNVQCDQFRLPLTVMITAMCNDNSDNLVILMIRLRLSVGMTVKLWHWWWS